MRHRFGTLVLAGLLISGVGTDAGAQQPRDPCVLLGALTTPAQDAQVFAVDLKRGETSLIGDPFPLTDVAGIAVHPVTQVLYALIAPRGDAGGFKLITVDRLTGSAALVGPTGLNRAAGLAIRPTDGSLWTWARGLGPAQIDVGTGTAQVVASSKAAVTDIAWRPDGAILLAAGGRILWGWDPVGNSLTESSKLPLTAGAIAMRADGRLLLPAPRPESGASLDAPPGLDRGFSLLILHPETGAVDVTLAAPPVPIDTLPGVAAARIESLTWPLNCGNPSPGGPADLIQAVSVTPSAVCPGGSVQVSVETQHPEGGSGIVNVTIAGLPGASRWVQFEDLPGPRTVNIAASTAEGYHDGESIAVEVTACDPATILPLLRVRPDPYRAGLANLEVQNAALVAPPGSTFRWQLGDGSTVETTAPFLRHSYAASVPRDMEFPTFDAAVTVVLPDNTSLVARKTVALWNRYAADATRGLIRPPVEADELVPLMSWETPSAHSILPPSATYTLRNIEDRPITLTGRQVEHQFCDPDRDPASLPWEQLNLEVGPGTSITRSVDLPDDEEVCGVGIHLVGTAGLLHRVAADVYFETRRNPYKTEPVSESGVLAALNAAAPLVSNPDRISDEELFQLSREKRIPPPEGGEPVPPEEFEPDPYVGTVCQPGEEPPYEGISCQATNRWTIAPPHIRNALKGDVIVGTTCGFVGYLLRSVDPPQYYSHSGIMTSNYYSVAHSDASPERYLTYPQGGGDLTDGVREDVLKYGWPGVIQQSVSQAFGTVHETDPSGASFELHGFSPNPAMCPQDEVVTYPIVIRPPADQADSARPMLKAAADLAKNAPHGNYRLYAYTDTGIGFDADYNYYGPATMCSGFVWRSLRMAGVQFEGPGLEPEDVRGQASVDAEGLLDGLYAYTETERFNAGKFIHNSIYDQVYAQAGWFGNAVTDAADDLANQFTNCFASDSCGSAATDSEAWGTPGVGRAVSPQDMLFWDSPATGGALGYHEPLVYRSGDRVRVYRWARSEGAGDVRGQVLLNGANVQGARVILSADTTRETASGADGRFSFLGVPSGTYGLVAQKLDGPLLLEGAGTVTVPAGGTGEITLNLKPPPEYLRRVTFDGSYEIVDDDSSDETASGRFYQVCNVDPFQRTGVIEWISECVGDEVKVRINITCELMADDTTVNWRGSAELWEQSDCDLDDLDGSTGFSYDIAKDQSTYWNIDLYNDDEWEPDWSNATFRLTVTNGPQP